MKLPPPPGCNVVLAERVLTAFLREEIARVGFQRAILGLSGGIDSAVVLELAARALGGSKVLGVAMPHRTSSPESLELARASARHAGADMETVDITSMADAHVRAARLDGDGPQERLRRGNIYSRTRMLILYDRSAQHGALVLGTSNKTELLLGYGTIFGDMACALNPLGDLYKTQIFALARHLGVPQAIVDRPPSADLWAGQTDEQELGFTYADVDALLHLAVDRRYSREALLRAGFAPPFVERVKHMVRCSQYKRVPPLVAKLANRTVNLDFRYPRDWGV